MLVLVPAWAAAHPDDPPRTPADLVVVNAKIWTVNREQPEVEAAAAWRGRILAVGTTSEVRGYVGPKTVVVDARGRRVTPGFHDCHLHFLGSGLRMQQVALKDARDAAEFGKRLAEFDRKLPRDRWMTGGEWDHDRAFNGRLPTAADIDQHVRDRPVFLRRYDGHMALANTRALQLAGITEQTADPAGGVIYRDPTTRQPTGLLRDTAMALVDKLVPPPTEDEIGVAVITSLAEARQFGVTSADDMDGSDAGTRRKLFRLYQRLARQGQLTTRIGLRWPIAQWEDLARLAVEAHFGSDYVRIGGLKGFMDGSLGSSTAKMFEPFVNEPDSRGVYVTPREQMRRWVTEADKAGLSVAVHAIGDEANAAILDIFADAAKANGPRDRRFRVEHAQHLRPADIPRFAQLGVIPSMQPYHVADDGRWAEGRIGTARCQSSYAFRSLLDAGARLAFGSDWSVAPLNPILGIDAAVNRRTLDGNHPGGWVPAQKIRAAEAVEAYTLSAAFASGHEKERGSVSPGKFADLVVLSNDILADANRDRIAETQVLVTIVGGVIVHDARPQSER
jgi:hypothetical protein